MTFMDAVLLVLAAAPLVIGILLGITMAVGRRRSREEPPA